MVANKTERLLIEAQVLSGNYLKKNGKSTYSEGREGRIYLLDETPHVLLEDNGDRGFFVAIGGSVSNLYFRPLSLAHFSDIKEVE